MTYDRVKVLIAELEEDGLAKVKENLRHNRYSPPWKILYVEDWIKEKEAPTYLYHELKAPTGHFFKAHEVAKLKKQGWVDSPTKFGKSSKSKATRLKITVVAFWKKEWKWILGFIATIIVLYIVYLLL